MSYRLYQVQQNPICAWCMDGASPYPEHSGSGSVGVTKAGTSAATTSAPLVSGAAYSSVFSRTSQGQFATPAFVAGKEQKSFALEAWAYPIAKTNGYTAQSYRENLILNPAATDLTNIQSIGNNGGTMTYPTDTVVPSGRYLRETWLSGSGSMGFGYMTGVVPVGTYAVSYWVRTNVTSFNAYNGEGTAVETNETFGVTTTPNVWKKISFIMGITTAGTVKIGGFISASISGDYIDISSPMVEPTTTFKPYFDGTQPGYEYAGTAGNSISRSRKDVSEINYSVYSSGTSTTGYTAQHGTVSLTTTNGKYGTTSVRATRTQTGLGDNRLNSINTNVNVADWSTVYCEAWVYSPVALNFKIELQGINIAGTNIFPSAAATTAVPVNTWTKLSYLYDNSAGTMTRLNNIQIVQAGGTAQNSWMEGDGWFVGPVAPSQGYFDGSFNGALWNGTANASPSLMLASAAQQQILSNINALDGLTIEGTIVRFSTNYLTTGVAQCQYDMQVYKAAHIVGIHTYGQNQLWVDGELVDSVNITDDQKADTFITTDNNLYSGMVLGSQQVALNGLAVYNNITADGIKANFAAGRNVMAQSNIPNQFGGIPLYLDASSTGAYFDNTFANKSDFETGYGNNVNFEEDVVSPRVDINGLSISSSWSAFFALDVLNATNIYGIFVEWSASNVVVEARVDTGSWTTLKSGRLISSIGPSFTTTNKVLEVRVTFPNGVTQGSSYLESIRVIGIQDSSFDSSELRTITASYPAVPRNDYEPIEYRENNGTYLGGGTLTIGADTAAEPNVLRTFEFWVKPLSGTVTLTNLSGGTRYINGSANSGEPNVGEWSLVHIVLAADQPLSVSLTGDAVIGQIAMYATALTSTEITNIWKSYTGRPVISFVDTGSIAIAEDTIPLVMYIRDWGVETG